MANIPNLSLKTFQFNPTIFTPAQYEFQTSDASLLERSLAQREARMEKAVQSKSAIDKSLAEIESKLNPSEGKWFEQYKQNIRNEIQSSIDSGDYGDAIRTAISLAGGTIQDPRILGRMKSQEAWNKEMEIQKARLNKGEISEATFNWWTKSPYAQYNYEDSFDANGNYIESPVWRAERLPVKDIDIPKSTALARSLIAPKKWTINKGGGHSTTNANSTGNGRKWIDNESHETVTVEDILQNLDEIIQTTGDGLAQMEQKYNVDIADYNRFKKEYDSLADNDPTKPGKLQQLQKREKLLFRNSVPISYEEYYARLITDNKYAKTLAYDNSEKTDNTFISNDYTATPTSTPTTPRQSGGSSSIWPIAPWNSEGKYKGANVVQTITYYPSKIQESTNNISKRFEDNDNDNDKTK